MTSSDSKSLLMRGSMFRVTHLVVGVGISFYMMPFVIHSVGDRWYGMWALVGALVGYLGFLDIGLSSAVQRLISAALAKGDTREINRLVSTAFVLFFGVGILVLLVSAGLAFAAPIFVVDEIEGSVFRSLVLILGASIFVTFIAAPINGLIVGQLRYDVGSSLDLAKFLVRTVLVVYFLNAGYSIVAMGVITLICDIALNVAKLWIAHRLFSGLKVRYGDFDMTRVGMLYHYGARTFVHQISEVWRFQVDPLIVAAFMNLKAVTVFSVGSQLVFYFGELMRAALGLLIPVFSRFQAQANSKAVFDTYYLSSKIAAAVAISFGGGVVVFGADFIRFWMGGEYLEAYDVLVVWIVPMIFYATQIPAITAIYGLNAVGSLAKASILEAIFKVTISLALVDQYGLMGVAIGSAIPLTFFSVYILVLGNRLAGGGIATYLRQVGRVVVLALLLQLIAWYVVKHVNVDGMWDIIWLASCLYVPQVLLILLLAFPRSERLLLLRAGERALGLA